MPSDLLHCVGHATTILGWYEHLSEDEMPPQWMWHLNEELDRHFQEIKAKRKSGGGRDQDDDDDEEHGVMMQNEYARGRGRKAVRRGDAA